MPEIAYRLWSPKLDTLQVIKQANAICADYAARGYALTLRQLYYQFVARGLLPNRDAEYNRLGEILNKARLAGLMDWDFLEDRTRNLRSVPHWDTPGEIIQATEGSYRLDCWANQPRRVEVWVEKDALVDVVSRAANQWDVAYFSCRGYNSQSEMWAAGQRHMEYLRDGQGVVVLHLGDHDPSGLQMSSDIEDRLSLFVSSHLAWEYDADVAEEIRATYVFRRIALNPDQIRQYAPPPNPAKQSDSRYQWYVDRTGFTDSWELDALDPDVLNGIITDAVRPLASNIEAWNQTRAQEGRERELLRSASAHWPDVVAFLEERFGSNGSRG